MTENEKYLEMPWSIEETIENLKIIKEHLSATVLKTDLDGKGKQDAKEVEFDFNRAIKALEEIQQYRAIGTVEDLKSMKENGSFSGVELAQIAAIQMRLKKYEALGTVEEFETMKKKSERTGITIKEYVEMPKVVVNGKQYIDKDIFVGYALNLLEDSIKDALSEGEKTGIEYSMQIMCSI